MRSKAEELICIDVEDIDEPTRDYINKYKKKQNPTCKWVNYKHGDRISLEAILEIVEMPPFLKASFHLGEASRMNDKNFAPLDYMHYITSPTHREEFKNLLISNVPFEKKGEVLLFTKWEVINWMEREREVDSNFVYTLPQGFINYCKKRKSLPSYSELLEENKELKQEKKTLEKEITQLQKKVSDTQHFSKMKTFIVNLASQIKKDMVNVDIDGVIVRAILMFLNFKQDNVSIIDSEGREVKGLSLTSVRNTLIEANLMSADNKVGRKSKEMRNREDTILKTINDLFKKNQYRKLHKEAEEIKKKLKYKKTRF